MSQGARFAISAAIAAALAAVPAASAAAMSGSGGRAVSAAGPVLELNGDDASNQLAINLTADGTEFLIFNAGGLTNVYSPCTRVSPTQARCPAAGVQGIASNLGDGNDALTIGPEIALRSTINGGAGLDTVIGGSGADAMTGGPAVDRLAGRRGGDKLSGDAGRDVLNGGAGRDVLGGGLGADTLRGGRGHDVLVGGPGRDTETQ